MCRNCRSVIGLKDSACWHPCCLYGEHGNRDLDRLQVIALAEVSLRVDIIGGARARGVHSRKDSHLRLPFLRGPLLESLKPPGV